MSILQIIATTQLLLLVSFILLLHNNKESTILAFSLSTLTTKLPSAPKSILTSSKRITTKPFNIHFNNQIHGIERVGSSCIFSSKRTTSNADEEAEARTGWFHNQPSTSKASKASSTSSSFSRGETTQSSKSKTLLQTDSSATTSMSSSSTATTAKTGWLHYPKTNKDTTRTTTESSTKIHGSTIESRNHRIPSNPKIYPCGNNKRAVVTEHIISVPLSRSNPTEQTYIDVFYRVVQLVSSSREEAFFSSLSLMKDAKDRGDSYRTYINLSVADTCLLYLQGGPGFGAPTPITSLALEEESSWAAQALSKPDIHHVVLMDQRGTGRSSPITKQTLELLYPDLFSMEDQNLEKVEEERKGRFEQGLEDAVEYLSCFRADNIVLDAEEVKASLLNISDDDQKADRPWGAALGQSFGGFCLMTYLSNIPSPPKVCLFTGGIAPIESSSPVELYKHLFSRVKERNLRYYEEYPEDIHMVKLIIRHLASEHVVLPSGGILTPRRFLQLGLGLGGTPVYNFASLHSLITSAFLNYNENENEDDTIKVLSRAFIKEVDASQVFDEYPLYFLLHESIYAHGNDENECEAMNWVAHRALQSLCSSEEEGSEWDYESTAWSNDHLKPVLFYGEMVFPWMSNDYDQLSGHGMTSLASSIANKTTWSALYNIPNMKQALALKKSKACAAVYVDDMYVDFNECQKVLKRGGPLQHGKAWISNEYQHSGLRDDGSVIFDTLWGMAIGSKQLPS